MGFLKPCSTFHTRVDFWKAAPTYNIGRSAAENDIHFSSLKISNKHCSLQWDGKEDETSCVMVLDHSSNGTFINGQKIGKGKVALLRDGNEIAFGSWASQSGAEDYRYIFRFTAPGPPRAGLYKHYDIGNELGKGTFATVMSAVSRETGQWYAVKMIQRARFKAKGPESERMFMREISILESLDHPNICQFKETFEDDQTIHIVLEYIDGGDLLDHIVTIGGLGEDHTRLLTVQLCDALAYIHSKGIAHRDLKPENVLLTKDNPPIIKVADFGLAKAVNSMTMFRTTCGTPCYLAPEVILRGPEDGYDHLVDSWSVGVIVFSMLTNTTPFIEPDGDDLKERFKNRYVDWDSLERLNLSDDVLDFIRRLLEDDPKKRMSLTAALDHPWLAPLSAARKINPRGPLPDPSFASVLGENGSFISNFPGLESQLPPPAHAGGNAEMSQEFEKISIDDATAHVPGAYPNSQTRRRGRTSEKPLSRRVVELEQQDPDGSLLSWTLVKPDDEAPAPGSANGNGKGKKRKNEARSMPVDDSDSSLTPVSEDEEYDADASQAVTAAGRTRAGSRGGKAGSSKEPKSKKGRMGVKATTKAGPSTSKRTRANAAREPEVQEDQEDDVDMEVDAAPTNGRPRRQRRGNGAA